MNSRFTAILEIEVDGADHLDAARTAEAVISDPFREPFFWTIVDNDTNTAETLLAPGEDE